MGACDAVLPTSRGDVPLDGVGSIFSKTALHVTPIIWMTISQPHVVFSMIDPVGDTAASHLFYEDAPSD